MPKYKLNEEHKGIELYFDTTPDETILQELHNGGWKWHRAKRCWYSRHTRTTYALACRLCDNRPAGQRYLESLVGDDYEEKRKKVLKLLDMLIIGLKRDYDVPPVTWDAKYQQYSLQELVDLLNKVFAFKKPSLSVDIDNLPYRERKRLYGCIYAVEQRCQEIVEELSVRWHQQALKKYLLDNDCEDIRRQTRICIMCGNVFTLEKNEVESYLTKNLHLPKRCPTCIRKNEVLNASQNAHTLENPFYYESQVYYSKLIGTDDKFWRSDNFKPRECYIDADKNNQPLQSWLKAIMKARLEYCKQQLQIDGISKRWFYFDLSVCYSFFKDEDKKNYYAKKHLDAFDEESAITPDW